MQSWKGYDRDLYWCGKMDMTTPAPSTVIATATVNEKLNISDTEHWAHINLFLPLQTTLWLDAMYHTLKADKLFSVTFQPKGRTFWPLNLGWIGDWKLSSVWPYCPSVSPCIHFVGKTDMIVRCEISTRYFETREDKGAVNSTSFTQYSMAQ